MAASDHKLIATSNPKFLDQSLLSRQLDILRKPLVIGIGAQKAGTSWLHTYLARRGDIFMSPLKELHYFDALYRPYISERYNQKFVENLKLQANTLSLESNLRHLRKIQNLADRIMMIQSKTMYLEHFRRHMNKKHLAFGEITPAYSVLYEDGFQAMADMHPDVRIIFLMRDPVERFYSALRMSRRAQGGMVTDEQFVRVLEGNSPVFIERTLYHITIERLLSVFDERKVLFKFYETLFCDKTINRICDFIGLPFKSGNYDFFVNTTDRPNDIPAEIHAIARERFDDVYRYCRERFGSRVPESWS